MLIQYVYTVIMKKEKKEKDREYEGFQKFVMASIKPAKGKMNKEVQQDD